MSRNPGYTMSNEEYLETLKHLWRFEEDDWIDRRIYSWQRILEREVLESRDGLVKSYWDAAERFYVRAKPRKNDKKIYLHRKMAYTPFESEEQIIEIYSLQHPSVKSDVHRQLLSYASHTYRAVPQEFSRVELIAHALYSKEYVAKIENIGPKTGDTFVVDSPRDFTIGYLNEARNHIERSKYKTLNRIHNIHNQSYTRHERSYVEVTFDFFLGSLEHAYESEMIDARQINGVQELFHAVDNYNPDVKNCS